MRNCSILIPTYNGRDILAECLPSVAEAVSERGGDDEILIIDNASADGTRDFIEETFPSARVIRIEENKAIFALNDGAREAKHDYLFFLNNDMLLKPGCIDALLAPFDAPDVFAVTGKVYQWDGLTVQASRRRPYFHRGFFWYLAADEPDLPGLTLYALGGQSIFSKEKFMTLGGLDTLFSPFYHEDIDLSWRAFRRGWRVLYEPTAEMMHRGATTAIRLYSQSEIKKIMHKNLFLFMWKNLSEQQFARRHLCWLPARILRAAAFGDRIWLAGFASALMKFPEAIRASKQERDAPFSSADVFRLFAEDGNDFV